MSCHAALALADTRRLQAIPIPCYSPVTFTDRSAVGGVDDASTRLATALYEQLVETVGPVSSTRVSN